MLKIISNLHRCMRLETRIVMHIIIIVFVAIGLTHFTTYDKLEQKIKESSFKKLIAIREIKKTQIQEYFNDIKNDIYNLCTTPFVLQASVELSNSFNKDNYNDVVLKYDKLFKKYTNNNEFYDLFLIDTKTNNIIYTVAKEADFATNIETGISSNTNLYKVYQIVKNSKENSPLKFTDFEHYKPSDGKPAAFLATTVKNKKETIAVLAVQIPIDKINKIMTGNQNWENEGLGKSGETYLISDDCTMRNDSRFFIEQKDNYLNQSTQLSAKKEVINKIEKYNTTILHQEITKDLCNDILESRSGTDVLKDYRGIEVFSAYAPLDIDGLNWSILSEIDYDEEFLYLKELKNKVLLGLFVIFTMTIFITILFSKTVIKPLFTLTNAIKNLGTGDLSKRIHIDCDNEFGELASCFNNSVDELAKMTTSVEHFSELSATDNLTHIYNRLKLNYELDREIIRAKRTKSDISLVMFDIDNFKDINDTFGHDAGDEILKELVKLVKNNIRDVDIFARWGGSVFMLLIVDANILEAKNITEKIRLEIEQHKFNNIGMITCSFGLARFSRYDTKEELISRVNEALYKTKQSKANAVETK